MIIKSLESGFLYHLVTLCQGQIFFDHFPHQLVEADLRRPSEASPVPWSDRPAGFPPRSAESSGIDGDDVLAVGQRRCPFHRPLHPARGWRIPSSLGGMLDKFADRMLLAGGNDKSSGALLLQHQPLHLHIVLGMAPVPLGIQVAQIQAVLQTQA